MTRAQMIKQAQAAGWTVTESGTETHLWRRGIGVAVCEDRTSYRLDVKAEVATYMARSYVGALRALASLRLG